METMNALPSRTYVLVHGAFVGAWSWSRVVPELVMLDSTVYAPALTGVGERAEEATPDVGLLVHIDQITRLVEANDLRDVVLVGHSYGGMVVAGVARRVPRRVAGIVYVDVFVPEPGQSAFDVLPSLRDAFRRPAAAGTSMAGRAVPSRGPRSRRPTAPRMGRAAAHADALEGRRRKASDRRRRPGRPADRFVHCARGKFFDAPPSSCGPEGSPS